MFSKNSVGLAFMLTITIVLTNGCQQSIGTTSSLSMSGFSSALEERIVYTKDSRSGRHPGPSPDQGPFPVGDIYTVRPDGTDERRLTNIGTAGFPAWSRDGLRIAYTVHTKPQPQIWIMEADGSNPRKIPNAAGVAPSWSPNETLVFMGPVAGSQELGVYSISTDGTGLRLLRQTAFFPNFSSDGKKIVFTGKIRTDRLHNEIFTMTADGSDVKQITFPTDDPDAPDANAPSWSLDGSKIAFFCGFEGDLHNISAYYESSPSVQQVCVIDSDGRHRRRLTKCDYCGSDNPGWSPDNHRVFFDRGYTKIGKVSTHIINIDGTNEKQLLPVSYGGGRLPWRGARYLR